MACEVKKYKLTALTTKFLKIILQQIEAGYKKQLRGRRGIPWRYWGN